MKKKTKKQAKKSTPVKGKKVAQETSNGKITPLGDRVLLKDLEGKEMERKTESGIYIPSTIKEDKGAKRAKVVAVGAGRYEDGKIIPVRVKVGDIVLYTWGDNIIVDGEEFVIVRESELSAILK